MKARVFSGVQPTGQLHIGNYLGALKNWAEIQSRYESIFCIVDLHAVTIFQNPTELAAKIRETAALFIAAGIDPGTVVNRRPIERFGTCRAGVAADMRYTARLAASHDAVQG